MASGKKPFLKMQCKDCKAVNYFTRKTKKVSDKKLEQNKYCKVCKKHTSHKEGKR